MSCDTPTPTPALKVLFLQIGELTKLREVPEGRKKKKKKKKMDFCSKPLGSILLRRARPFHTLGMPEMDKKGPQKECSFSELLSLGY
jgi:hypothetical protein